MKITCKEYNRRFKEKNYGYVVRIMFGTWCVCDGLAPDSDMLIDEHSLWCGTVLKSGLTMKQADELCALMNL